MPVTAYKNRILVALSGGVDSSVCSLMLAKQNYDVEGVVFLMSDAHAPAVAAAQKSAEELGIELHIFDLRGEFEKNVILPFCETYCFGKTPNPCIICNPLVKFKALCDMADKLGIREVATGHYALVENICGEFIVKKALSLERDQSYMLYRLPQSILSRLVLPLGCLMKQEVRALAQSKGLSSGNAPDSQEICFIPDNDYPSFIHSRGMSGKPGSFIYPEGFVVCAHKGVENYTVGQRRGLNVSFGKPVYVSSIEENGNIKLGYSSNEYSSKILVKDAIFTKLYEHCDEKNLFVKVRSAAKPAKCTVSARTDNSFELTFETPLRAPAPGQSAVLYCEECIVAGGIIECCFC
ncbi:MAG: tRNA 2-thiouridine(34) synthase MnmA [Oscillospiraceae bacterium]